MIELMVDGRKRRVDSMEALDWALRGSARRPEAEIWVQIAEVEDGPAMCMHRNGMRACLSYLRFNGDAGFVSQGDPGAAGDVSYRLSNGQVDRYPLSWCIEVERCYQAIRHFFAHNGARTAEVQWLAV